MTQNPDVQTIEELRSVLRQMGWGGDYNDVGTMVSTYNAAWANRGGGGGGGGGPELGASWQYQLELAAANQLYLEERLRLLDIPGMYLQDERERHQLALQAVSDYAAQTGWYFNPTYIERRYGGGGDGNGGWKPFPTSPEEIAEMGGIPTMEMTQMLGNPRNLAQSLIALGQTPEEVGQFLQNTPFVRELTGYPGVSFDTPAGRNPNFSFIGGRAMPARQTLEWFRTQAPQIPLTSSLASFSGQTPESFWGEFSEFLPKGKTVPPATFV